MKPKLTKRQKEVARLVSTGLPTIEVAKRLGVSRYTVASHLRKMFQVLGVTTRTQLAAVLSRGDAGDAPTDLAGSLRSEMTRIARQETQPELAALRGKTADILRDLAEIKRLMKTLIRQAPQQTSAPSSSRLPIKDQRPFSPRQVKLHRKKLGLSAANYGRLLGVTAMTIYRWERGRSAPRGKQLAAFRSIEGLQRRGATRRLNKLST